MNDGYFEYALVQLVLAHTPELKLTNQDYVEICQSRRDLTELTAIEEKYDLLLENHLELELELTKISARDMLFSECSEISFWDTGNLLNRRIINILSSCRSYLDHTDHHLSRLFGKDSAEQITYNKSRNTVYDNRAEFRIAEAMRNYVQHRGFPLHNWTLGSKKVGDLRNPYYEFRTGMRISYRHLDDDGKFNKRALKDIEDMGGSADLVWIMRGYIETLSQIHAELRKTTSIRVNAIRSNLESAIRNYTALEKDGSVSPSIAAVKIDEDGVAVEKTYLVPGALDFFDNFRRKNVELVNFSRRHVSSRVAEPKEDS